jgi:hypothetical protein
MTSFLFAVGLERAICKIRGLRVAGCSLWLWFRMDKRDVRLRY